MHAVTPVAAVDTIATKTAQNIKHWHVLNLSAVRHSARLANGSHMPIM
jgi:hypothetical protein